MDLYNNDSPAFTSWVIENDLLKEPFVVIDVGVQGGPHPRWNHLKEKVRIYGFDAIDEVVEGLNNRKEPHRIYHAVALGDEEGTREFYVREDNTFGSSFYEISGQSLPRSRRVATTRLDTLFAKGTIPPADYIKVDCDGHDPEVIRGGRRYLAQSNVLCVSIETAFTVSPPYPKSHFVAISDILTDHRLLVFDLNLMRTARPAYVAAKAHYPWPAPDPMNDVPALDAGAPGTIDALFCRDFVAEQLAPSHFTKVPGSVTEPTTDKIIKSMINFELHGLMDCAVELAEHFRSLLSHRLDVDTAVEKLMRRPPYARNTADVTECLRMIGELRTLVFQHEGVAEADRMHVAERDAALAQRDAAVARIGELQSRLERFEQSHADAMAEANRIRAAERDAAVARIGELQSQLERFEQSHADAMAEASRVNAEASRVHAEASRVNATEREAAIVRIQELVTEVERLERFSIARAIQRVARLLAGGRRIARRIVGE
jgi:FkbM family methyltransferase